MRRPLALAAVAVTLLSATFAAAPVAVAAPGDPNQVALFVQYPDGSTASFCVGYRSGMSGADVLAVASPSYGSGPYAGFVLEIDGQGTVPPTNDRYWAYWRGTQTGSYTYSGSGVTSTKPAAGSVEAWIWYENGEVDFPRKSYATLCPRGTAAPAPAATSPAPTPTGVAAPTGSGGGGSPAGTTTAPGDPGATAPGTTGSAPPGASGTAATTTTPSGTTSAGGSGSPGASTSVAASSVAATDDAGGLGAGSTVGLIAAGTAVLALGALAVVARRRRAEQD